MDKTYAVLNQGGPVSFVTGKLNELEQRRMELSKGIDWEARMLTIARALPSSFVKALRSPPDKGVG
jgi:hypothetical protein